MQIIFQKYAVQSQAQPANFSRHKRCQQALVSAYVAVLSWLDFWLPCQYMQTVCLAETISVLKQAAPPSKTVSSCPQVTQLQSRMRQVAEQMEADACQQAAHMHASLEQEKDTWAQLCR